MLMGGLPEAAFAEKLKKLIDSSDHILDIGTAQRFAKELRTYEPLFANKRYVAAGFEPKLDYGPYNCDCHQDIEAMTFEEGSFDGIICLEVLEHVRHPFKAVSEIKRVLKEHGSLLLTVPFMSQFHGKSGTSQGHGFYPDYWRFTHEGLTVLFDDFSSVEVIPLDGPIEFRLKQFYFTYLLGNPIFRRVIDLVDRPRAGKATSRHMLFARK